MSRSITDSGVQNNDIMTSAMATARLGRGVGATALGERSTQVDVSVT